MTRAVTDEEAMRRVREQLLAARDEEATARGARGAHRRLAERLSLSEAQVSRILNGASVSPATLARILSKLGSDVAHEDQEIAAMRMLASLAPDARARVVAWAVAKWELR